MFVVVAKSTSLSQASEVLHIGQPGLTRAIKDFEEQLNVEWFLRSSTRRLQPTEQGLAFISTAERLLFDLTSSLEALAKRSKDAVGCLRVGASYAFSYSVFPHVLSVYAELMPKVQVKVYEDNNTDISRKLCGGGLDIGIGQT